MDIKEWAQKLDGREYREELTKEEAEQAHRDGVIIAFGASDDLLEVMGIIDEEYDAFEGKDIGLISAIWSPKGENGSIYTSWLIESPLPHEHFNIYEDGELYCVGAIIEVTNQALNENFGHSILENFIESSTE